MVEPVNVGQRRIMVTAYNPTDALSLLYCRYLLERIATVVGDVTEEEVHAWLRANVPGASELLDMIEEGWELEREVPKGEFPVTPGQEKAELRIIGWLKREAKLQHVDR